VQYTEREAKGAAIAMSKKTGVRFNAYRCKFCYLPFGADSAGGWHVGHAQTLTRRLGA